MVVVVEVELIPVVPIVAATIIEGKTITVAAANNNNSKEAPTQTTLPMHQTPTGNNLLVVPNNKTGTSINTIIRASFNITDD